MTCRLSLRPVWFLSNKSITPLRGTGDSVWLHSNELCRESAIPVCSCVGEAEEHRCGRGGRRGWEGVFMPWAWRRHRFAWSFETERTRLPAAPICEIPRRRDTSCALYDV